MTAPRPKRRTERFQLGLRKLLLWTAVVAVLLGILRMLNWDLLLAALLTLGCLIYGIVELVVRAVNWADKVLETKSDGEARRD